MRKYNTEIVNNTKQYISNEFDISLNSRTILHKFMHVFITCLHI